MASKPKELTFEQRLLQLEELVAKMEEGGMSLEALLAAYQEGVKLSASLSAELDAAQGTLVRLRGMELEPMETDADDV